MSSAFCLGSDSNNRISPIEEMRWLEYGQRLATKTRGALRDQQGNVAKLLLEAATLGGAKALGVEAGRIAPGQWADFVAIDLESPSLMGWTPETLLESVIFGATEEVVAAMVSAALGHIHILESLDFNLIKVSMKASDPPTMIAANRAIADKISYPLHLGVTEAGPPRTGAVKSAVGIGVLLEEGIGDTIRVSLAGDSVEEVEVGYGIVNALAEKLTGPNLIACPMCGRLEIDMLPMVAEVEKALKRIKRPINVSVMGCVVNGPGEGQHADIGIAGGKNKGILFKHGKIVGTFPEKELVPALLRELDIIAKEDEQKLAS